MSRHERRAAEKRARVERTERRAEVTRKILQHGDVLTVGAGLVTMEEQLAALDHTFPPLERRHATDHREVIAVLRSKA